MGNRIDNGLQDNRTGDFEGNRGLDTFGTGADMAVDFAQNKLHSLIDDLNQSSLIGLLGCDGFLLLGSMEMKAMDLNIEEKLPWIFSEKKYGRIRGIAVTQQVEIL